MKRLVCYTVEGLMRQGPHQVWVTLGAYPTVEQAQACAPPCCESISETRIIPYFRSSESTHAPHLRPAPRLTASANSSSTANAGISA